MLQTTTSTYAYYSIQVPSAYITMGKNRVKQYNNTVYMNDKQEFEIELFNPKTTAVLAKIKINGNYISTRGLYLKPGQRVFLDRFIDNNNKLLFSTYDVADSKEVREAIANNGAVEIEFYDEYIPPTINYVSPMFDHTYVTDNFTYTTNSMDSGVNSFYSSSIDMNRVSKSIGAKQKSRVSLDSLSSNDVLRSNNLSTARSIETGRIERGGSSSQSLTETSGNFNTWFSTKVSWKIMPQSQEPVQFKQQTNYCTSCGSKIKKETFKYCPNCGNKLI